MSKVIVSRMARNDARDIKRYISEVLNNPAAAQRIVTEIKRSIRMLEKHSYMGIPLWKAGEGGRDYRSLIVENYRVLYRIDGNTVYVVRILYGRRDYLRTLFELEQAKPEDAEE